MYLLRAQRSMEDQTKEVSVSDVFTDWKTTKSTTEKLEAHLFELERLGYEPHTIAFVGGRDWVIVALKDVPATAPQWGTTPHSEEN